MCLVLLTWTTGTIRECGMRNAECGITLFTRFLIPYCAFRIPQSRFVPIEQSALHICAPCAYDTAE